MTEFEKVFMKVKCGRGPVLTCAKVAGDSALAILLRCFDEYGFEKTMDLIKLACLCPCSVPASPPAAPSPNTPAVAVVPNGPTPTPSTPVPTTDCSQLPLLDPYVSGDETYIPAA